MTEDRHEDVLRRIACGDLGPEDREVRELVEGDPTMERSMDELRTVAAALDAAARRDRALSAQPTEADVALVRGFAEPRLARPARRPRAHRIPLAVAALAAAVLAVFWLVRDDAPPPPVYLGQGVVGELVAPVGEVADDAYGRFEWRTTTPGFDGRFVVVVSGAQGRELARSPELDEPAWSPAPEVRELLRRQTWIRWEVTALDRSGTPAGFGWAEASSSR